MKMVLRAGDDDLETKLKELRIRDARERIATALAAAQTPEELKSVDVLINEYIKMMGISEPSKVRYGQEEFNQFPGKY